MCSPGLVRKEEEREEREGGRERERERERERGREREGEREREREGEGGREGKYLLNLSHCSMDGFRVVKLEEVTSVIDILITATGMVVLLNIL